jgi:serine/threonine protein kinase
MKAISEFSAITFCSNNWVGGFSLVYLAQDKQTNQEVALKVMLPKVAANQRAVNWFMRELKNMKVLKYPKVVGLK